jgi:hypothetical protein
MVVILVVALVTFLQLQASLVTFVETLDPILYSRLIVQLQSRYCSLLVEFTLVTQSHDELVLLMLLAT